MADAPAPVPAPAPASAPATAPSPAPAPAAPSVLRGDDDDGAEFTPRAAERIQRLAAERREARKLAGELQAQLDTLKAGQEAALAAARQEVEGQWKARLDLGRLGVDDDAGIGLVTAAWEAAPKKDRPTTSAEWWAQVVAAAQAGTPPAGLSRGLMAYLPAATAAGRGSVAPRTAAPAPAPHAGEARGGSAMVDYDPSKDFRSLIAAQRARLRG